MGGFAEYDDYDGLGLASLVRKGAVTPSELVDEAIARIERLNPQLNAVIQDMYDIARETAAGHVPDGPFKGVPFLLKDVMATYAGVPMCAGSRFLKDFVPDHDSELVKRFKAAGVVIVGKTNLPEFGIMPITEPLALRPDEQPLGSHAKRRRLEWRLGRRGGRPHRAPSSRKRWGWLDSDSRLVLWRLRPQAEPRPQPARP